jgi:hypothetical protein
MRAIASRFNVRIRFQDQSDGASLSDVKVVVLNEKNEPLLRLVTEGPLLYMKMPKGRYLLEATYEDTVKERAITVGRGTTDMTVSYRLNAMEKDWRYCANEGTGCSRQGR